MRQHARPFHFDFHCAGQVEEPRAWAWEHPQHTQCGSPAQTDWRRHQAKAHRDFSVKLWARALPVGRSSETLPPQGLSCVPAACLYVPTVNGSVGTCTELGEQLPVGWRHAGRGAEMPSLDLGRGRGSHQSGLLSSFLAHFPLNSPNRGCRPGSTLQRPHQPQEPPTAPVAFPVSLWLSDAADGRRPAKQIFFFPLLLPATSGLYHLCVFLLHFELLSVVNAWRVCG